MDSFAGFPSSNDVIGGATPQTARPPAPGPARSEVEEAQEEPLLQEMDSQHEESRSPGNDQPIIPVGSPFPANRYLSMQCQLLTYFGAVLGPRVRDVAIKFTDVHEDAEETGWCRIPSLLFTITQYNRTSAPAVSISPFLPDPTTCFPLLLNPRFPRKWRRTSNKALVRRRDLDPCEMPLPASPPPPPPLPVQRRPSLLPPSSRFQKRCGLHPLRPKVYYGLLLDSDGNESGQVLKLRLQTVR